MILTQQQRVPFTWIVIATSITAVASVVEQCSGAVLTFTLRKFTGDPALIAFIGSINIAFNFLVAPYMSWKSDRVWTRWGRRKPFIIVGYSLLALALIATPHAPSLWALVGIIIAWQFAVDFGYTGTWSPLFYEIVPVSQRGRAVIIKRLLSVGAMLAFNYVMIGQFDRIYHLTFSGAGFAITGEQLIYYTTAGLVGLALLNVVLNIREQRPAEALAGESFAPGRFFRGIFAERQFLLIYLLLFCSVAMSAWLGQLGPLLITEQFGYAKKVYGQLEATILLIDIVVTIPIAIYLADRFDRFRVFQVGLVLATLGTLSYWIFVKWFAPVPMPWQIVAFSLAHKIPTALGFMAIEPYFFDLTPRDKMGTMNSGFLIVRGVLNVLLANGLGLWVKYYSRWFAAPGVTDYSSALLYVLLVGLCGCLASLYFDAQRRRGRIIEYGKLAADAAPQATSEVAAADAKV